MSLPLPPSVRVTEEIGTFTPLGLRFWDPVLETQVREGLRVRARALGQRDAQAEAYRSRSDIYVFRHLPGLRSVENAEAATESPQQHSFVVTVDDPRGRFVSMALPIALPLPYRGIFLAQTGTSPGALSQEGVRLFSSATRATSPLTAVVRAELVDAVTGAPAAHALLSVRLFDGHWHHGLADERGRVAVFFPYPTPEDPLVSSPPVVPGTPLADRRWELHVEVRHEPSHLVALPFVEAPDYLSVLTQGGGSLWPVPPELGGAPQAQLTAELRFGAPTLLRTSGRAELLVSPLLSSP